MGKSRRAWKVKKDAETRNVRHEDRGSNANTSGDQTGQDDKPRGYTLSMKQNAAFENYYKTLGIVPDGEWDSFLEHLRSSLPATFRVTGYRGQARELVKLIKGQYLNSAVDLNIDGKKLEPPKCLPWYPDELAWQLNLDRSYIRKSEALKKLHEFLVSETESGNISRQEAVSMLPPLALDVESHHKILDMCAAPGSKTSQLIEMLHADENVRIPEGFVVANDSDNKRCYLMVHQVKRLESPNFMIINHDASQLPNMRFSLEDRKSWVNYDRVLCDVPCSGDGTMRKNPDVWGKWNSAAGLNLHGLQCRILKRGIELLAVGGRLVYSTCSFNPIENEAVVAHLLEKCNGAVKLVDASSKLPGLKSMPGLKTWKVMTRNQTWYEKAEDVPTSLATQVRPTMFPPSADKADELHLDRCVRVLPHHQNTGGFFLAVFEKTRQVDWFKGVGEQRAEAKAENGKAEQTPAASEVSKTAETDAVTDGVAAGTAGTTDGAVGTDGAADAKVDAKEDTSGDSNLEKGGEGGVKRKADPPLPPRPAKKSKLRGYREDPFIWLTAEDPVWPPIREFFGISDAFRPDLLMVRCREGKKRNLYYTSDAIKKLVLHNDERVKFINMGVKVFARSDSQYVNCDFRMVNDGVSMMFPFVTKRVVEILPEDIVTILVQDNPYLSTCSTLARNNLEPLDQGGIVYVCKPDDKPDGPGCQIILTGWKGRVSTRSFLRKFERSHYLRLCGSELKPKDTKMSKKDAGDTVRNVTAAENSKNNEEPEKCDGDKKEMETDVEENIKKDEACTEALSENTGSECKTDDIADTECKTDDIADIDCKTDDIVGSECKMDNVAGSDCKAEQGKEGDTVKESDTVTTMDVDPASSTPETTTDSMKPESNKTG